MPQRRRRRRYHIKPVPVVLALLLLFVIIFFAVKLISSLGDKPITNGNKDKPSSQNTSVFPSSQPTMMIPADPAGTASVPSDTTSEPSSVPSSENTSKDTPKDTSKDSSKNTSKDTSKDSSKPTDVSSDVPSSEPTDDTSSVPTASTNPTGSWNLVLLNRDTAPLEKDMSFEKTKIDAQYVDSRAAGAYQEMYDAAKEAGITLFLRSGYRSISEQVANYNASINRYVTAGKSKEEATKLTDQYYARPGQSEHHSGLAFDIITPEYHNTIHSLDERFAQTDAYKWLIKNCATYGFVLRYPSDKVDITGYNYEPWHYRYVGKEAAADIMGSSLCLEEYLARG